MKRQVNNTRQCIECGAPVPRKVKRCPPCNSAFRKVRPTYERTPERNLVMSQATKGLKRPYPTGGSLPGVAEKIRQGWTPEKREAARQRGLQFSLDPQWREKIAMSIAGPKNPRWEDGRAVLAYTPGFADKVRQLVRERDGHQCVQCDSSKHLCVHHKDFEKSNHSMDNLELLCRRCHTIVHVAHRRETPTETSQD